MKNTLLLFFVFISLSASAQNFQVHYDMGNNRNHVTTTFEMFKPDKWGNTFTFTDMDFNSGEKNHPSAAYMEIARCLKFWKAPFSVQLEYNGGLLLGQPVAGMPYSQGFNINNAYLAGIDYGWNSEDFTKFLNFKVLYKNISGKNSNSFQITGVWNLSFLNKKLTVSGFADFWKEDNMNFTNAKGEALAAPTNTEFVFLSEPQFWYNATENISVGSEIEFGYNFGTVDGLKICPTFACKWNF